mgnify:CR=1 FL=1
MAPIDCAGGRAFLCEAARGHWPAPAHKTCEVRNHAVKADQAAGRLFLFALLGKFYKASCFSYPSRCYAQKYADFCFSSAVAQRLNA